VPAAGEAFKFVLCTSVNSEIVHGMPNAKRVLKQGDIVSIDTGVKLAPATMAIPPLPCRSAK